MAEHDDVKYPRGTSSTRRRRGHLGREPRAITLIQGGWVLLGVGGRGLMGRVRTLWERPAIISLRELATATTKDGVAGIGVLLGGMFLLTLLVAGINYVADMPVPSPGFIYLPLVAMLAYHWGWRHALAAGVLELICVYLFFLGSAPGLKPLSASDVERLVVLAIVTGFVLALVQLARTRRAMAEREAGRFAALNAIGAALARELDERRLLDLIARTACDLANAEFAAFTLRPLDALGQPLGPSEGQLFHLAAVVGVTPEQEALFKRMPLGGEGLLMPIFRQGIAVRVDDARALQAPAHGGQFSDYRRPDAPDSNPARAKARSAVSARGQRSSEGPHALGIPYGHPMVRSFLGAPLLDRAGTVRGGLLLGHAQPGRFSDDDEALLLGLAAQASVALENARLYRAAQTQAQELDTLFESIADGITLLDAQGRVMRENAAARAMHHQLDGASALASAVEDVLHTSTTQARGGHAEGVPVAITDPHGERRHYLISASPLRAPQGETGDHADAVSGAVVLCHDVTEVHRLDEERRERAAAEERRALLQTVIDELPSAVYLVRGADARLVLANRASATVLGAEWPPNTPMAEFLAAHGVRVFGPSGAALSSEELATIQTIRTGETIRHQQEVIRQPNGALLPVLLNAVALDPSLVRWPDEAAGQPGQPLERAALVIMHDVTALKEAERLKDEFIAIAAHELRNPMAAIKGYAQLLTTMTAKGKGAALADWQAEALETIDSSTTRLVELTDDLLDVTRLQAGRLALRLEPADLAALTRRVLKRLQVTAPQHTVRFETDQEFVVVRMDAQRIEQVLGNLINNAIKYSPDGGEVLLTLRERPEQGTAELAIRDHGIGIPQAQQARLFGRFARADNARERGIGGTGLGLFLCRELVERHGGRIWFESVEGQGSTFSISLPLVRETDDEGEADGHEVGARGAAAPDSAGVS